ncbi:hypothetical protein VNO77_02130 [Canavalia gladiata]|uniref:Uncharacterized protein n=1 Tax=Canavalia gladiata TaxID=3824 RepID=A0AAN9MT66_CANGL
MTKLYLWFSSTTANSEIAITHCKSHTPITEEGFSRSARHHLDESSREEPSFRCGFRILAVSSPPRQFSLTRSDYGFRKLDLALSLLFEFTITPSLDDEPTQHRLNSSLCSSTLR